MKFKMTIIVCVFVLLAGFPFASSCLAGEDYNLGVDLAITGTGALVLQRRYRCHLTRREGD